MERLTAEQMRIMDESNAGAAIQDNVVYQRTREQRDFWKERAENLLEQNKRLQALCDSLTNAIQTAGKALTPSSGAADK